MTLLFIACTRCGRIVDDPETLAAAHRNFWNCPECGAENKPLAGKETTSDTPGTALTPANTQAVTEN